MSGGLFNRFDEVFIVDCIRTPQVDYNGEVHTSVEAWAAKTFRHRHVVKRGDDMLCEGTETRAFVVRDVAEPEGIKAIPVPEDIKALCS